MQLTEGPAAGRPPQIVEVLTSFCARQYGHRWACNRALRALTAAKRST